MKAHLIVPQVAYRFSESFLYNLENPRRMSHVCQAVFRVIKRPILSKCEEFGELQDRRQVNKEQLIVISKFLEHHLKAKRMVPAYSRALRKSNGLSKG